MDFQSAYKTFVIMLVRSDTGHVALEKMGVARAKLAKCCTMYGCGGGCHMFGGLGVFLHGVPDTAGVMAI